MKWYELIVSTNQEGAELTADAFFSIGCDSGVKILDRNDVLDALNSGIIWDYVDEKLLKEDDTVRVSGFVSLEEKAAKLAALSAILEERKVKYREITEVEIDDVDWFNNWKRHYSAIEEGDFVIVPKWLKFTPSEGKTPVFIDPSMAFGTGEHESTRLCLRLLSGRTLEGKKVIDVGTGSGILGIAAALRGAECYLCDIDSIAVAAAQENARLNNVEVKVELADLLTLNAEKCDLMLANLTADILIRLSADAASCIKKGGVIICSGIIHARKAEVIKVFALEGFTLMQEEALGEWNALTFSI